MSIVIADIMGVSPNEIPGVDESLARRVLATARSITPCLDNLEGERKQDAIAILQAVALEVAAPGMGRVRSQSRNGTSITFADVRSAFGADERAALRALCSASPAQGIPVGSFPRPAGPVSRMWPETYS